MTGIGGSEHDPEAAYFRTQERKLEKFVAEPQLLRMKVTGNASLRKQISRWLLAGMARPGGRRRPRRGADGSVLAILALRKAAGLACCFMRQRIAAAARYVFGCAERGCRRAAAAPPS